MTRRVRKHLLVSLIWLYPAWWKRRYGTEFTEMIIKLVDNRQRDSILLALDIIVGALDARFTRRSHVPERRTDLALRRGVHDGLIVAAVLALVVLLSNVVFAPEPTDSDTDAKYVLELLLIYLTIGVLLAVIGARGRRRANTHYAGLRAGATAGLVIAVMVTLTYLAVNNLFFATISQQHEKLTAFADSGWTSMRAYITVSQLRGAVFLIPFLTMVGGALGHLGGLIAGAGGARHSFLSR